ncbi:hypothetical protein XU18_4726 [Perkinsela sp. CCAP 1560/4]|nr:hypothetical protein XU18_4726 [Perkinsela sp. CCAP 1560/4]|eukprot:KNH03918.1 hypothetical protein XU18_4726 [Perkinsela sp. CCAP 1560/4]
MRYFLSSFIGLTMAKSKRSRSKKLHRKAKAESISQDECARINEMTQKLIDATSAADQEVVMAQSAPLTPNPRVAALGMKSQLVKSFRQHMTGAVKVTKRRNGVKGKPKRK